MMNTLIARNQTFFGKSRLQRQGPFLSTSLFEFSTRQGKLKLDRKSPECPEMSKKVNKVCSDPDFEGDLFLFKARRGRIGDLRNKGFRAHRSYPELMQDPDHDGATTTAAKPFPAPPSYRALDQNPHL
ncbi:hypothetical protein Agabi119p4_7910 [Agaricus bisporus var. burnettii]|uniref:Uncharacterized protein n=1 Tax=Agaricus bisporus var. burnettii TaxID=192524 RepID=A0A8H7EZQ4_AGABI|nr:hypothetical protein Agabi119p4_7910 [Agaricus bisporus var. burnettii]